MEKPQVSSSSKGTGGDGVNNHIGERRRLDVAELKADLETTLQESRMCEDAIRSVESGMTKIVNFCEDSLEEVIARPLPPEFLSIGCQAHREFAEIMNSIPEMVFDTNASVETYAQLMESARCVSQLELHESNFAHMTALGSIKHKLNGKKKIRQTIQLPTVDLEDSIPKEALHMENSVMCCSPPRINIQQAQDSPFNL